MSLIFLVDRLWLLGGVLLHGWKLCTAAFLATQRPNIVRTASDWDLLALLTSIRTQNRIKRFVAGTTYRWISLPANRRIDKQSEQNVINSIIRSYFIVSDKAIDKVRYYFKVNVNQPILLRVALRRAARMLRSQQGANPKGLSDVGTSENWGKRMVASRHCLVRQPQKPIIRINGSSRTKLNYLGGDGHDGLNPAHVPY